MPYTLIASKTLRPAGYHSGDDRATTIELRDYDGLRLLVFADWMQERIIEAETGADSALRELLTLHPWSIDALKIKGVLIRTY